MTWHSDLISGSCPRAPLDYFCTCFKTFDGSPVRATFPTNTSAQIWLSRSRLFLKLFFSIFSVHLSSTIDLMKDTFTTCRTRQACWWRRSTQAQWYKVTSTAVENSPEVHEEMILTERSVKLSHMTPSHLIFASSVFLLPHAAQQVWIQTVTLF